MLDQRLLLELAVYVIATAQATPVEGMDTARRVFSSTPTFGNG